MPEMASSANDMINPILTIIFALAWVLIGVGCWLGWQLLRQNGRMLLRLDELENRLDEMEFGEADEPVERSDELQGRARHSVRAEAEHGNNGAKGTDAFLPGDQASRFSNRSLARSRVKRDGLKAATSAPSFRLPRLDGGELSLEELRGKRVLLVFSDPHCGPCQMLAPQLEKFHREHPEISVVMISRGEPKENRAKAKENELTFPVVLQQRWEVSRLYAMFATPIAYLIDEAVIVARDVAVGVEPILALASGETVHNDKG
jgi:peroxiredoxin